MCQRVSCAIACQGDSSAALVEGSEGRAGYARGEEKSPSGEVGRPWRCQRAKDRPSRQHLMRDLTALTV